MATVLKSARKPRSCWRVLATALLLAFAAGALQAQDAAAAGDPPARVARLSYAEGDLGLLPAGAKDWSDAQVNRPLLTGDRLSTGSDARAEVELGGTSLRMDASTDIGLLDLNQDLAQIELTQGSLNLSVHQLDDGQSYEIDTPTIALVLESDGVYRVDIDAGGNATSVTAFRGDATAYGENGASQLLHAGNHYNFADSSLAVVHVSDIRGEDTFDYWCADRDSRYAQADSDRYVGDDVVGAQDLDQYGDWQNEADYGEVWYPDNVATDWAPYQDGQWTWVDPWGWTWVDAAPWGFAPFHYGRWAYVRNRWGWIPGPRDERAIYAPALVAFVGGNGWDVSIGGGAPIGWFPLGPGDIYFPWYRSSRDYYSRVNISNIHRHGGRNRGDLRQRLERDYGVYQKPRPLRDIHYANRNAPHAYSVVSASNFAEGRPVRGARLRLDAARLSKAPLLTHGADVRPHAQARGGKAPVHARSLPLAGFERNVVARHAPPAAMDTRNGLADRRLRANAKSTAQRSHVRVLGGVERESTAASSSRGAQSLPSASLHASTSTRPSAPARGSDLSDSNARTQLQALRSSRFARPQAPAADGLSSNQIRAARESRGQQSQAIERPGVSFVGNDDAGEAKRRRAASENTLPRVPVIHRAGQESPTQVREQQPQRFAPADNGRMQRAQIQRAPPRFEPSETREPAPTREWNRPTARPAYQRPQAPVQTFRPPPPQPVRQAREPARSEPQRKSPPPASNDDRSDNKRRWRH